MADRRHPGLVTRLTGLVVDIGLLTIASLLVSILPGLAYDQLTGQSPGWVTATAGLLATVLPAAYFAACWWLTGQTLGGLLTGSVVTRIDGSGVQLVQAVLRSVFGLLLAPVWLAGLVTVLFDGRRRALHDMVFRTVVHYRR